MVGLAEFLGVVLGLDELNSDERGCLTVKHKDADGKATWKNYPVNASRITRVESSDPQSWYFCVSTVTAPDADGVFKRRESDLMSACVLILDDIGTKVSAEQIKVAPSYVIETSNGNFQWGYLLEVMDVSDVEGAAFYDACTVALGEAGLTDRGMRGAWRVGRVPGSLHKTGFQARVVEWNPDRVWALQELMDGFGVKPAKKRVNKASKPGDLSLDEVQDPVLDWLKDSGRVTGEVNESFVEIICPWADEHTEGDTAGYSPLGYGEREVRGFSCFHDHCQDRNIGDLLEVMNDEHLAQQLGIRPEGLAGFGVRLVAEYLPDVRITNRGPAAVQLPTRANTEYVLNEWGLQLRYNVMANQMEMLRADGICAVNGSPEYEQWRTAIVDELLRLGIKAGARVDELFYAIASDARYHPVENWLRALEWDGRDHINTLAGTVTTESELWPIYLRKWLIQAVEAVCGWSDTRERDLPYMLVFTGEQDVGKSTWFRKVAPNVPHCFKGDASLHLDGATAKDDQIAALSRVVVEIGELDSTFSKSHDGALKNFLSRTVDEIRAPYGRTALRQRRGTVFCGTVNDEQFLRDETGSKRFWPVAVDAIEWDANIDYSGVWAQAFALWADGETYRLTADESRAREQENEQFRAQRDGEARVFEFFDEKRMALPKAQWMPLSATQIGQCIGLKDSLLSHPAERRALGIAARRLFGKERKLWGQKRRFLVPITETEIKTQGLRVPNKGPLEAVK